MFKCRTAYEAVTLVYAVGSKKPTCHQWGWRGMRAASSVSCFFWLHLQLCQHRIKLLRLFITINTWLCFVTITFIKSFWNWEVSHLGKWTSVLQSKVECSVANRGNNSASVPEDLRCYLAFESAVGQIFCKGIFIDWSFKDQGHTCYPILAAFQ